MTIIHAWFVKIDWMTNPNSLKYRPDIDGLLAFAVLSVVLFHAFPHLVPGGFVGVDVFFVISGYLITQLILAEIASNTFSISKFYARRIKRIFPALVLVLGFSLLAGWVCLNALEYQQLGFHAATSAVFISNFQFIREAGYFDNAADTKPLLHLWSLSIEEQFYVLWPVMLLALQKTKRFIGLILLALIAVSLGYSLYLWQIGDMVRDFYSPFSRFWELWLGGLLACMSSAHSHEKQPFKTVAAWSGSGLMFGSVLFFNDRLPFPSYWALLPTAGAALIIYAGPSSSINRYLLAAKPIVYIGLISYPLYLWHWPLLSLARIIYSQTPPEGVRWILLGISMLLAVLTYRLIERPIRFTKNYPKAIYVLLAAMFCILLMGHLINKNHGLKFRHSEKLNADPNTLVLGANRQLLKKECGVKQETQHLFHSCFTDGKNALPQYAVLGDSKAEALAYSLIETSNQNQSWVMMGDVVVLGGDASPVNQAAFAALEKNKDLQVIVLANALRGLFPLDSETGLIAKEIPTADIVQKVAIYTDRIQRWQRQGLKIVFVIDNPTLPDPNSCLSGGLTSSDLLNTVLKRVANPNCKIKYSDHVQGTSAYQHFIQLLKQQNPSLLIYDPLPVLCDTANDVCTISKNGQFLYSYGDHISDVGGRLIAHQLLPLIEQMRP